MSYSEKSETRIRQKINGDYIYEVDVSDNQHAALKKHYDEVRKDLNQSALEYTFEEYIDDTINDRCRRIRNPRSYEQDYEMVTSIMKEHPEYSPRDCTGKSKTDRKRVYRRYNKTVRRRKRSERNIERKKSIRLGLGLGLLVIFLLLQSLLHPHQHLALPVPLSLLQFLRFQ